MEIIVGFFIIGIISIGVTILLFEYEIRKDKNKPKKK